MTVLIFIQIVTLFLLAIAIIDVDLRLNKLEKKLEDTGDKESAEFLLGVIADMAKGEK